jgi:acetyl esterase
MPVHPQCQFILDQMAAAGGRPLEELSVAEARAQFAAGVEGRKALAGPPQDVARLEDRTIEGAPVRVYWPSTKDNLPVLVYFHGGGWVLGDLEMVDRTCRALANAAQCMIVSVDYGLAPEHKFPQPVDEAYRVTKYMAAHAAELGADPNRIAVGGDSAGGNLAASVALKIKAEGGPRLALQMLIYPVTDYDDNQPSFTENEGIFLSRASMKWFWGHYLPSPEESRNPLASILKAQDLGGLPAAMVVTAECDPLRDQGEAFAHNLQAAGVPVQLKRYEGAIHAFFGMFGVVDSAKEALADAARALREAFGIPAAKSWSPTGA